MKNIIKGYISTIIGLLLMLAAAAHGLGYYTFPQTSLLNKPTEVGIAFFIGVILFFVPYSKIEKFVEDLLTSFGNWIKSKFSSK